MRKKILPVLLTAALAISGSRREESPYELVSLPDAYVRRETFSLERNDSTVVVGGQASIDSLLGTLLGKSVYEKQLLEFPELDYVFDVTGSAQIKQEIYLSGQKRYVSVSIPNKKLITALLDKYFLVTDSVVLRHFHVDDAAVVRRARENPDTLLRYAKNYPQSTYTKSTGTGSAFPDVPTRRSDLLKASVWFDNLARKAGYEVPYSGIYSPEGWDILYKPVLDSIQKYDDLEASPLGFLSGTIDNPILPGFEIRYRKLKE